MKPPTKKQIKESEEERIKKLLKAQEEKEKEQNEFNKELYDIKEKYRISIKDVNIPSPVGL